MQIEKTLNEIPTRENISAGEELFQNYRRGEISTEDYYLLNAMLVARNFLDYRPMPMPIVPKQVLVYVSDRRLNIKTDPDPYLGAMLSSWLQSVRKTLEENLSNLDLLRWAGEKLETAGNKSDSERLKIEIERAEKLFRLPDDFMQCAEVQDQDRRFRAIQSVNRYRSSYTD